MQRDSRTMNCDRLRLLMATTLLPLEVAMCTKGKFAHAKSEVKGERVSIQERTSKAKCGTLAGGEGGVRIPHEESERVADETNRSVQRTGRSCGRDQCLQLRAALDKHLK